MILTGKHARAAVLSRAHREATLRRRVAHESRPNVVVTPLPLMPEKRGVCPNCGRAFNGPNVPHFHLRACKGAAHA